MVIAELAGVRVAFLARHRIGHVLLPSEVNYRPNIAAFKLIGIDRLVSISACGSLRIDFAPGDLVIPDQLFDWTHKRERSIFGDGLVAHVSAPEPFCPDLSRQLAECSTRAGARVHSGGTSITIEGPRFSTRAESNTFRSWGMSIVGMTTAPEAFLAREAELCYAVMAHVTDYDVWHLEETPVSVEMVLETLNANTRLAQACLVELTRSLSEEKACSCSDALRDAFITRRVVLSRGARRAHLRRPGRGAQDRGGTPPARKPQRMSLADEAGAVRTGEALDAGRLGAYLAGQVPGLELPLAVRQFPAGFSNLTYLLTAGNVELVLRRPPFGTRPKSGHDMSREFRVLSALKRGFAECPGPVHYCADEAVIGAPFYVVERIRGVILRRDYPPELPATPGLVRAQQTASLTRSRDSAQAQDHQA